MATTKFYLDTRAVEKNQPAPLKITITLKGKSAHLKRGGLTAMEKNRVTTNCEKSAEPIVVKKFL